MPCVYIVADPTSSRFKFGVSSRNDNSRVIGYKTVFADYESHIFPCTNARDVEGKLKKELAPFIIPHADTGRPSEIADRGKNNCNLFKAIRIILDNSQCYTSRTSHSGSHELPRPSVGEANDVLQEVLEAADGHILTVQDALKAVNDKLPQEITTCMLSRLVKSLFGVASKVAKDRRRKSCRVYDGLRLRQV